MFIIWLLSDVSIFALNGYLKKETLTGATSDVSSLEGKEGWKRGGVAGKR
jgi:hypothetical protein